MANYYIDPGVGTGDGSSDLNPAGALPGTIQANTNYLIKAGTTLQRSSAIGAASKNNIVFDTWYGTGQASVVGTASNISLFSTSGTTSNFTLNNLRLESLGGLPVFSFNSPLTSLILENFESHLPIGSVDNHVNFTSGQLMTGVQIKNFIIRNGNRAVSLLCTTANLIYDDWLIEGLDCSGLKDRIIRLTTEPTNDAWLTSVFNNFTIRDVVGDRNYGNIWVKSGYAAAWFDPPVQGDNLLIENITLTNSAEFLDNLIPGGVSVMGCKNGIVRDISGINITTTGGIVGSSSNTNMLYEHIYAEHAVSVNEKDGCGIFCDRGTRNSIFRHSEVVDCPGYTIAGGLLPIENRGGGVGIWEATGNSIYGNIVKDSLYGFFYGDGDEAGNKIFNNIDIGCESSLKKIGTAILAGNLEYKNNISIGSSAIFDYDSNPSCTPESCASYASADLAGIALDASGIPCNIYSSSECVNAGADLSIYVEDKNGNPFYSPPNQGAFSTPRDNPKGWGFLK